MGERKGQNKYYPPDFDYKTHKSLAGYHGQHPLRERARKINQGILIIRFEMPYNIWCDGCKNHIGMGVRYNAEKSKVGMYYTTPIYKFRMKCHLCNNHFEIKTDPANHDYVIISGARRKEQRWDPKENEQVVPEDRASQKKLATDAMYKLEHASDDKAKIKQAIPGLGEIEFIQYQKKDDYILNKLARKKFRDEKVILTNEANKDHALLKKSSLDIELVKEHEDDVKMAGLLKYHVTQSYDDKQKQKRREIESRPLFGSPNTSSSTSTDKNPFLSLTRNKLGISPNTSANFPFGGTFLTKNKISSTESLGIVRKFNAKTHSGSSDTNESSKTFASSSEGDCRTNNDEKESPTSVDEEEQITSNTITTHQVNKNVSIVEDNLSDKECSSNSDDRQFHPDNTAIIDGVGQNNALNALMSYDTSSDSGSDGS